MLENKHFLEVSGYTFHHFHYTGFLGDQKVYIMFQKQDEAGMTKIQFQVCIWQNSKWSMTVARCLGLGDRIAVTESSSLPGLNVSSVYLQCGRILEVLRKYPLTLDSVITLHLEKEKCSFKEKKSTNNHTSTVLLQQTFTSTQGCLSVATLNRYLKD